VNDQPQRGRGYDRRLGVRLLTLLSGGPQPLGSLVRSAEGAYPTDVLAKLKALEREGKTKELDDNTWAATSSRIRRVMIPAVTSEWHYADDSGFPEPHPLDFDWRFSRRTLIRLNRKLNTARSRKTAVLGAPTLFRYLRDHHKSAHLYDRNEQIVSFLRNSQYLDITDCDLFSYSGQDQFDCVIADPPWYLAHYRAFIEAARQMLVPEKTLLLSVLPPLTRPSAQTDRAKVVKFAFERGFDLIKEDSGFLEYASPPFELEALRSEGFHAPNWRSGDLFTFALANRKVSPYKFEEREDEKPWRTFTLDRTIVKIKWGGAQVFGKFAFEAVSETHDFRLRSVSLRSPPRSKINLWTSRNIALRVTRPDIVCTALQLISKGYSSEQTFSAVSEADHLGPVEVDKLRNLLDLLIKDSKKYDGF